MLFWKNLVFTIAIPGTVAVVLPLWLVAGKEPGSTLAIILALPFLIFGAAIYTWCVWDFATLGRGTPLPLDAPKKLVVRGLYRHSRNPMYVGVLCIILGWLVMFQSLVLAAHALAVFTLFQLFITLYEEPHLRRVFGAEYENYCRKAGRWLPRHQSSGSSST